MSPAPHAVAPTSEATPHWGRRGLGDGGRGGTGAGGGPQAGGQGRHHGAVGAQPGQ